MISISRLAGIKSVSLGVVANGGEKSLRFEIHLLMGGSTM